MSKLMTVDVLASIKGAKESEAVKKLFEAIKKANTTNNEHLNELTHTVSLENLRADVVINSSEIEKELISKNFPKQKNGYLVVQKVIEE